MLFTAYHQIVRALADASDLFAGDPETDVLNMSSYNHAIFILHKGAGAVGTAVVTVEAASDTLKSIHCPMPFRYRINTTGDTWGPVENASVAGFTTTAAADQAYIIEVEADEILNAGVEHDTPFDGSSVYIVLTESVDDPVTGGVLAITSEGRYSDASMPSAI